LKKIKPHKSKSRSKYCSLPKTQAMKLSQFFAQEKNLKNEEGMFNKANQKKHIKIK